MQSVQSNIESSLVTVTRVAGNSEEQKRAIRDIASDNVITPSEKIVLKREWQAIISEYPIIVSNLTNHDETTLLFNYQAEYQRLYDVLVVGIDNPGVFANMNENTTMIGIGEDLVQRFSDYYIARDNATLGGTIGIYTDYIFRRSAGYPDQPTGEHPLYWEDTPPEIGTEKLWMSKAVRYGDGTLSGSWSLPAAMSGEQGNPGPAGGSVTWLGDFEFAPLTAVDSNAYHNTLLGMSFVYNEAGGAVFPSATLQPSSSLYPKGGTWFTMSVDAPELISQYSVDGSNWHAAYLDGDYYMRTSADNGITWSPSLRIKGEAGVQGGPGDTGDPGPVGPVGPTKKYLGTTENKTITATVNIINGPADGDQIATDEDWVLYISETVVGGWKQGKCYRWNPGNSGGASWDELDERSFPEEYMAALYDILSIPALSTEVGYFGALFCGVLLAQKAFIDSLTVKKLLIDTVAGVSTDFEARFDETNGLLIQKGSKVLLSVSPSGVSSFSGTSFTVGPMVVATAPPGFRTSIFYTWTLLFAFYDSEYSIYYGSNENTWLSCTGTVGGVSCGYIAMTKTTALYLQNETYSSSSVVFNGSVYDTVIKAWRTVWLITTYRWTRRGTNKTDLGLSFYTPSSVLIGSSVSGSRIPDSLWEVTSISSYTTTAANTARSATQPNGVLGTGSCYTTNPNYNPSIGMDGGINVGTNSSTFQILNIPTTVGGMPTGTVYRTSAGYLKIV